MRLSALWYLTRATFRNRVRAQLARLKRPRYLVALLVGLAYIALIFYRPEGAGAPPPSGFGQVHQGIALASGFALAVLTAKWWLFGASTGPLAFTPAEIQLLFPAPLKRRDLILYRLLRVQSSMLISAAFIALLLWRSGGQGLALPLRMIGLWILFATSFMHQMGVTLVRTAATSKRNIPALVIVAVSIGLLGYYVVPPLLSIHSLQEIPAGLARVGDAMQQPIPLVILAPFRWIIAPAYAGTTREWLAAIGPAVGLLIFHYLWVLRADAVFEDAAVDASARRAARIAARAAAARTVAPPRVPNSTRTFVRLSPHGPAWSAIVWKNATAIVRGLKLTATIRFIFVLIIALSVVRAVGYTPAYGASPMLFVGIAAAIGAVYLTLAGPLTIRNDLRGDLAHLPMLRTYPLGGRTVVFAEVLSSALTLTALQVILLFVAFGLLAELPLRERASILVGALVVLPAVNLVSLTIQNAIALIVPAWVRLGRSMESGQIAFEALGQQALGMIASIIALVIALAPAAGVGVLIVLATGGSPLAVTGGIVAGLVIIAFEVWFAIYWLGDVFDRTDAVGVRA